MLPCATGVMPASASFCATSLNSSQVLGSSAHADLLQRRLARPHPVDAVDVHRRRDPGVLGLHDADQGRRHDLVPILLAGQLVEVGGVAGRRPLGDLGPFELDGGRRVARQHLGAQLAQRVGGVARDRRLLPVAALGLEHLAELGDRQRIAAGSPLVQQVGLGLGLDAGAGRDAAARPQGPAARRTSSLSHRLRPAWQSPSLMDLRMRRTLRHHMAPARLV